MALQTIGAQAVLKGVRGFLGGMKKMSGAMGTFAKTAAKIGGIAVAGIGAAGAALTKLAIDAAPLEGISAAFEGITADFEGGSQVMLKSLQESSLGMVSNRDLMLSFNKAAQLVSKDFAKDLPNAMQFLGKVSAATGDDMGFLMDSLVRGVGRLSPMILDNLGIQVDLTEAYEEFAKANNTTVEEMSKTEQQAAVMAQVMTKLETNTADMPEVLGTASQQMATFRASLQNTKDEIGIALLPLFKELLTHLQSFATNTLPLVVDWVQNKLVPALAQIGEWIMTTVVPAIQTVVGWFQDTLPGAISTATGFFNTTLLPAITAVAQWFQGVLLPALMAVWGWISTNLIPLFVAVAEVIGATLGVAVEALAGLWQNHLLPAIKAVWSFLSKNLAPVFEKIAEVIQGVIDWLGKLADKISSIRLPSWLERGSPSPFEMTFIGAGEAIKKLATRELPRLSASLQMAQAPALAPVNQQTAIDNRQMNIGTVNNNNRLDEFAFDQAMRTWLGG